MSSTPFHSFDAAAGSTLNAASASYGATSDGDQVDDMLADLAAELSDESYGAVASTLMNVSADAIYKDFIPKSISEGPLAAGLGTVEMAKKIAASFAKEVDGKEGGWPGDAQGREDIIEKAIKDAMFEAGPNRGKYAPMIALEFAKQSRAGSGEYQFPQYEDDLLSLATYIWTGKSPQATSALTPAMDWRYSDVDESIKEIVADASKYLASQENPADQLGITSEISLSQGDINELAVILWLGNELGFHSYEKILSRLYGNPFFPSEAPAELILIDPRSDDFYQAAPEPRPGGVYSEVAPEPPASGGFGMPRPQTILAFGYLLSAGGPLFQAAFGRKS
jgi:hypothetical protein